MACQSLIGFLHAKLCRACHRLQPLVMHAVAVLSVEDVHAWVTMQANGDMLNMPGLQSMMGSLVTATLHHHHHVTNQAIASMPSTPRPTHHHHNNNNNQSL
jgi:hypothetical protein